LQEWLIRFFLEYDLIKAMLEWLLGELMKGDTEESRREFMRRLKERGVRRVRMFISDAHQGIQAAIKKEWLGSCSKRCKVHFMRNILVKVSHRDKACLAEKLK
jgi:transposase-like protein